MWLAVVEADDFYEQKLNFPPFDFRGWAEAHNLGYVQFSEILESFGLIVRGMSLATSIEEEKTPAKKRKRNRSGANHPYLGPPGQMIATINSSVSVQELVE
jgi:hypothetical protein